MILILSLSVWFRGGTAFSPGRLSAKTRSGTNIEGFSSHAEFEGQCSRCHKPVEVTQNILCLNCHLSVAGQQTGRSGIHGGIASSSRCADCHPDHQGQGFDPSLAALPHFDHTGVAFSLSHHQFNADLSPMACSACHDTESETFAADEQQCNACHTTRNADFMRQHNQDFGLNCLSCHDGQDSLAQFDHSKIGFSLVGKHSQASCTQCHTQAHPSTAVVRVDATPVDLFSGVSQKCVDCHQQPASHKGVFEASCDQCHDPAGWQPAKLDGKPFDHEVNTSFSLDHHQKDYQGQPMTCSSCHSGGFSGVDIAACASCHGGQDAGFMQQHTSQYGPACLECHDGLDRMRTFDHSRVFPLEASHSKIPCLDCHTGGVYHTARPRCADCHSEPAIHLGFFGLECQECHTSTAWSPAFLKQHSFPLDHGEQGQVACQTCHPASYIEYTCYGCHDHQPDQIAREHTEEGISSDDLPNCTKCHPTGREKEGD